MVGAERPVSDGTLSARARLARSLCSVLDGRTFRWCSQADAARAEGLGRGCADGRVPIAPIIVPAPTAPLST